MPWALTDEEDLARMDKTDQQSKSAEVERRRRIRLGVRLDISLILEGGMEKTRWTSGKGVSLPSLCSGTVEGIVLGLSLSTDPEELRADWAALGPG